MMGWTEIADAPYRRDELKYTSDIHDTGRYRHTELWSIVKTILYIITIERQ
ncbi:hypothetical protein CD178_02647 [Komagataeibacter saccharivorans]|uniref:Uncharacterized protein n=1 Tax=Komagataeibacter saccharivorans TaxID=265959 RepID=A0A347WEV1_9PROT|nr:hypothetical protein [Komagataeibacter saccharivorans]AXY23394.1 hypothetical protein CD178_02647 [Komagataeibacter saccharivorans]